MKIIDDVKERGILIVDDDLGTREAIRYTLKTDGYLKIFLAKNGAEALSKLAEKENEIYLALLDLRLPDMDGMQIFRHLSNVHKYPIGVIIITGYPSVTTVIDFFKPSDNVIASGYIEKPFDLELLKNEVRETLENIHRKRLGYLNTSADMVHKELFNIKTNINNLNTSADVFRNELSDIKTDINNLLRKQHGFLRELGLEVVKILLLGLLVFALLYFGIGDFLKTIIK